MAKKPSLNMRHLITMENLDEKRIKSLISDAKDYLHQLSKKDFICNKLSGKVVTTLFFEPSTRTRYAFVLAAQRLGALVLNPNLGSASIQKGETLIDTVRTFEAMGTNAFVIRHPDNNVAGYIASELMSSTSIINAGDGSNQHPTQTLLDLFTISQYKSDFKKLKVAIVGDIAHARVTHSLVEGLKIMQTEEIRLVAPEPFLPEDINEWDVDVFDSLEAGLDDVDVIYTVRIQKERMDQEQLPDNEKFFNKFGITTDALSFAKPEAIVMHPGPMNRGVEIESMVADGPQSVILNQVRNGVAMRMAILETLLND